MKRIYFFLFALASCLLIGGALVSIPAIGSAQSIAPADGTEPLPPGTSIQTLLPNMNKPIAMAFDPAGRLFYTEKESGQVRLFANGVLQASPVITFSVDPSAEGGLLGIAIDPNFSANHRMYVFYRCGPDNGCLPGEDHVARFVENNGVGSNPVVIWSAPQTGSFHISGNLHFGPDGKLYLTAGENGNPANSQDVTVPNGKMHRINPDGSIPADNPVFTQTGALPSLYAMGLRNSFDFTFDPLVPGQIFASENGPGCDDELNRIVGAYNYGWRPNYPCDDPSPDPQYNTIPPLWFAGVGECCVAPTGVTVYTGGQFPNGTGESFMASYNDQALRHFYLNPQRNLVTATNIVQGVSGGTDVETGPDGALWYIEGGGYLTGTLKRVVGPGGGTPTPSPTPADATVLIGHVTWQGRPAQPSAAQSLPITLTLRSGSGPNFDYSATTDSYGFFTSTLGGLTPGTYSWRVRGPQYLASGGTLTLVGGSNRYEFGLQRVGDANNDNCVNTQDFTIMRNSFGRSQGDPGYDARADFTGDNRVNSQDFSFLRANFRKCGAAPLLR